ncbi:exodeoxyribonuclease VII small subunit [Candidatus Saccharibacteria bacterium]|nr:exodeoxyribonuclease VII small subunit [Candidatus Saccharibacteria bacterium]
MTKSTKSYTELREELERVMMQLQSEDIDIDDAIKLHKQATALIEVLEKHLKTAKLTVTKLTGEQGK